MFSGYQQLACLALCCLRAANSAYIGQVTHEVDRAEEAFGRGAIVRQNPSSSRRISSDVIQAPDPQPQVPVTQKKVQNVVSPEWKRKLEGINSDFEKLRRHLSEYKQKESAAYREETQLYATYGSSIWRLLQELEQLLQHIATCLRDPLFKPYEKRLVLEPISIVLEPISKTQHKSTRQWAQTCSFQRKKLGKLFRFMGTSSKEKPRLEAGPENLVRGTAPESGKLSGNCLDLVIDRVKSGWLGELDNIFGEIYGTVGMRSRHSDYDDIGGHKGNHLQRNLMSLQHLTLKTVKSYMMTTK